MLSESERLQKIIETEQMTAKQFSEEVGIQAGTVSNIFKGRNKPSLEVMQKVLDRFRTISPDWLISGVGSMYRQKNDSQQQVLFDIKPEIGLLSDNSLLSESEIYVSESASRQRKTVSSATTEKVTHRKMVKVVVFYDDGTYEEMEKNNS